MSFDKMFDRLTKKSKIYESVLLVENTNGDFYYSRGYGGKDINSPIIMASITKLFTSTCIFMLQEQGRLSINNEITKYIDKTVLEGIHIYKGKDYSFELTIHDLLCQISGFPDVFLESKNSLENRIIKKDEYINFDEMIAISKGLKPHFAPRTGNRAYYADINFDLLGRIIETITELPLEQVYKQFIFDPLGLSKTYLPVSEDEYIPNVYFNENSLYRPKSVMCSRASGGCISTTKELMIFIKAFFKGKLFNIDNINKECIFRKMQFSMGPIRYGCGYMQIPLGGIDTCFQGKGELVGHFGSTGSFALYYPLKDLFFVGDVNQMASPSIPVRFAIQLAILGAGK